MSTPGDGKRRRAAAYARGFKAGQESMASINHYAPSRDNVQTVADCQPRQSPDGQHYIHAHNCAYAIRNNLSREAAPSAVAKPPAPKEQMTPKRWLLEEHLPGGSIRWHCFEHEQQCRARGIISGHEVTITPLYALSSTTGGADRG